MDQIACIPLLIRSPAAHGKGARDIYFYNAIYTHIHIYAYTHTFSSYATSRYLDVYSRLFTSVALYSIYIAESMRVIRDLPCFSMTDER